MRRERMKKGRVKVGLWIVLSVLLVVQLAVVGCGSEAPAGKEIRIGVMGGQTGPAAADVVALVE
jgi:hypothetical protein